MAQGKRPTTYDMIQSLPLRRVDVDMRSMFGAMLAAMIAEDYTRCPAEWLDEIGCRWGELPDSSP
jgi:hypothetical protein